MTPIGLKFIAQRRRSLIGLLVAGLWAVAGAAPALAECPLTPDPADNNAEILNLLVAETAGGGQSLQVKVVAKNTGGTCWYTDPAVNDTFMIGLKGPGSESSAEWADFLTVNPDGASYPIVEPGQTITFFADIPAPDDVGSYDLQAQMYQENDDYFGSPGYIRKADNALIEVTTTVDVVCPASSEDGVNDAEIVAFSVPDAVGLYSTYLPDPLDDPLTWNPDVGKFEVQLTVRNTGTNCWSANDPTKPYGIGGDPGTAENPNPNYGLWPAPHRRTLEQLLDPELLPIKPGDVVDLKYTVTVPRARH